MNINKIRTLAVFLLFTIGAAACSAVPSTVPSTGRRATPPPLAARTLHRGINLAHWFSQAPASDEVYNNTFQESDLITIRNLGFDFVRLPVDPLRFRAPRGVGADALARLDAALDLLQKSGLTIIVDFHPPEPWVGKLATSPEQVGEYAELLNSLAAHLSARDPQLLLIELLNEPWASDGAAWNQMQQKFWAAARAGAPRHTLVLTATKYSTTQALLDVAPVADPNIIYTFHFYEPVIFTHQGATWGRDWWKPLRQVPWPPNPESIKNAIAASATDALDPALRARVASEINKYGAERSGRDSLAASIARAASFARRHNVQIYCGEFGVYRNFAPPAARFEWMRTVRELFEANGIPWAAWEYHSGFGIVNRLREPDPRALAALGLREAI